MVHLLTIAATLMSVLLHGLLGCCWHHTHAQEAAILTRQSSRNCTHVSHCCAHEGSGPAQTPGSEQQSPDHDTPCDEESCVFYVGEVKKDESRVVGLVAELPTGVLTLFVQASRCFIPVVTRDCHDPELLRLRLARLQRWIV